MSENELKKKGRAVHIDIAKGIAICLMVYGHVNSYGASFIYLFHMPLFFILSGYVTDMQYNNEHAVRLAVGGGKKED